MRNLYPRLSPIREFDFLILAQAHNNQKSIQDYQQPNHDSSIVYSNFVTVKPMISYIKQSSQVIEYNGRSESDNNIKDIEFVDIDLLCNKISL